MWRSVAKLCRQYGAIECIEADDPAEGELLLEARRAALVALEQLGTTMIDDVCVPRSRLADFIGAVEQIAIDLDITVGVLGHAGDGNMHPTVVFDADRSGSGPAGRRWRSTRSWRSVWSWAARSPASTGSGC